MINAEDIKSHTVRSLSSAPSPTFLIAHPEEAMRRRLRRTLKAAGYARSVAVETGPQALDELSLGYNVLIVALDLPDLDCWRLLRMIRSGTFCSPALPVLVVCDPRFIPVAEPMAHESGACLLAENDLERLPELVVRGLEGSQKRPVLVVEDCSETARLIGLRLRDRFEVEVAESGEAGLRSWSARQHTLVLLDLMLPDIRGEVVLEHILTKNPLQLVIIITALEKEETHRALMEAGAVAFLTKPVDAFELPSICERLLHDYEAYRRQRAAVEHQRETDRFVKRRVLAASHLLETGRVKLADQQLRHIIAAQEEGLGDDEWIKLLEEVDAAHDGKFT